MCEFAKIPGEINTTDKASLKALCVFFALKQVKYNGCLTNFKKNTVEYAKLLGISPNTLRTRINYLLKTKAVYFIGKHLQLVASKKLFTNEYNQFYYYKFEGFDVKQMELFILANAIKRNYKAQEYIIKIKKVEYELSNIKTHLEYNTPYEYGCNAGNRLIKKSSNRSKSNLKKMTKLVLKYNANAIDKKWQNAQIQIMANTYRKFALVNPFISLSCRGVSRVCLGKTAPSTGHYLKQRLTKAGYITEERQALNNVNRNAIEQSQRNYNLEQFNLFDRSNSGVYGLRRIWKTIENKITLEF